MVRTHKAKAFVIAGALLLGSQLYAQPGAPGFTPPAAPTPTTPAPTPAVNNLSAAEMQAQSDKMASQLNDDAQAAQLAQAQARKSKDVIKLNCVNDSLVVTKQLVNVGTDARAKLDKAVKGNDRSEQVAQFQSLKTVVDSATEAKRNIGACIGAGDIVSVGPRVIVDHPVIHDDPTSDCNNLGASNCILQPLEYVAFASPFTPN